MVHHVAAAYGTVAEQYVALFGTTAAMHADDLELIERHLGSAGPVLDAGCGPGHLTVHLRSLGLHASGLDVTPQLLEHARASDPGGRYVQGSMGDLPVADASVAGIVAWYSLIHTPPDDLGPLLADLRRVIEPGGMLVAGFFDGDAVQPFEHQVITAWFWPVAELSARLRAAGFDEVERQRRPGEPHPGRRSHAAIVAVAR